MFSCYSILECYNLFSGLKYSIRSSCFICKDSQSLLDSSYITLLVLMGVELLICVELLLYPGML